MTNHQVVSETAARVSALTDKPLNIHAGKPQQWSTTTQRRSLQ